MSVQEFSEGGGASTNRYDRQLRLWGANGQRSLYASRILLLNCTPCGTEALKNLILPGCGCEKLGSEELGGVVHIVDNDLVTPRDLGNNYFMSEDFIGQPRAKCATHLLSELNPESTCTWERADPAELVKTTPNFIDRFTIVLATHVSQETALILSDLCIAKNIPLVLGRAFGLIGQVRLVFREHCVIESKPSSFVPKLRVCNPWPKLREHVDSVRAKVKAAGPYDARTHSHVPWLCLLVDAVAKYKKANNGKVPASNSDIRELRSQLKNESDTFLKVYNDKKRLEMGLTGEEDNDDTAMEDSKSDSAATGLIFAEDNYEEALSELNKNCSKYRLPPYEEFQSLMTAPTNRYLDENTPPGEWGRDYWAMVAALKKFVAKFSQLPLSGDLPDMFSTTEMYIALQNVYQEKAKSDCAEFSALLDEILEKAGRDPEEISKAKRKLFCANAEFLQVHRFRSLRERLIDSPIQDDDLIWDVIQAVADDATGEPIIPTQHPVLWYLALSVADAFYESEGRYPGDCDSNDASSPEGAQLLEDREKLGPYREIVMCRHGLSNEFLSQDHLDELLRFGGAQLHVVGAVIGGVMTYGSWEDSLKDLPKLSADDPKNFEDPYVVLGLDQTATDKQLKRAYRYYHPDKVKGDRSEAQTKFNRIREAYEILTDPTRKVLFEMHGMPFVRLGDAGKLQKNEASSYNFGVPLELVYNGSQQEVQLGEFSRVCKGCKGQRPGRSKKAGCGGCTRCPDELEMQQVQFMPGFIVNQQVQVKSKELCKKSPHKFVADIQKGVAAGHKIEFPAAGEQRPGLIPGDILLSLQIHDHEKFKRDGNDLKMKMKITLKESLLGFEKSFTHMDGRTVKVSRKGVTKHGYEMILKDEGMPVFNFPSEFGVMKITFDVVFPYSLTPRDKELLKDVDFS
eukprot:g558.t1